MLKVNIVFIFFQSPLFYFRLKEQENGILCTTTDNECSYRNSFKGCDLVEWLISKEGEQKSEAIHQARNLLVNGVIKHGK